MSRQSCKTVMMVGLLGLVPAFVGLNALQARPRATSLAQGSSLLRSTRLVYRDGRRFLVTFWRASSFPARFTGLQKVECRFVTPTGQTTLWNNDSACYFVVGAGQDATFGFVAQGHGPGQVVITIDDDVIGPIPVDEMPFDPCATPGPVATKVAPTRDR